MQNTNPPPFGRWTALTRVLRVGLVAWLVALPAAAGRGVHPQDGPHIDLRIAIEDDAVHVRTTINLAFADELIGMARENLDTIHPVEWDALRAGLERRFAELNEVVVDGEVREPEVVAFDVSDPDVSMLGLFPIYGARSLTLIQLDLAYRLPSPPEVVRITWGAYPTDTPEQRLGIDRPREVLARLAAGGLDSVITFFEDDPTFEWRATEASPTEHLNAVPTWQPPAGYEVPALSLVLLAAAMVLAITLVARAGSGARSPRRGVVVLALLLVGTVLARNVGRVPVEAGEREPDAAFARAVFEALHGNLYLAFDFTDESDVYDALAHSVEGDLLEQLYEEIYESLVQEEAAGAVGSVQGLEYQEVAVANLAPLDGELAFDASARWQVEGAVFHWGHAHWRVQELAGTYRVHETPDGWRIADGRITEQVLVSASQDRPGADGEAFEMPEEL